MPKVVPVFRKRSVLHEAAELLAMCGTRVFPCLPLSKVPATANGFQDATDDFDQIKAWWTENPDYNIAICPEYEGWAVIDIEATAAADWNEDLGRLPPTRTVQTPRGGRHLYFAGSVPSTVQKLAPKVDSRGRGGYVLVEPSIVFDEKTGTKGQYKLIDGRTPVPVPDWVLGELHKKAKKAEALASIELDQPGNVARAVLYLKNLPATFIGDGSDTKTFAAAAACRDLGVSQEKTVEIMMAHWRCTPKDREWVALKVANAFQHAENEPGAYATPPLAETFKAQIEASRAENELAKANEPKRSRFYPIGEEEMENLPPVRWMVKGLLQEKKSVLMVGETQSYKSFIALDLALAIATGTETFGDRPVQAPTFYAALEGLYDVMGQRREAWKLARGYTGRIDSFFAMSAPTLNNQDDCDEFIDQIRLRCDERPDRGRPQLIVLETLNRLLDGLSESDSASASLIARLCEALITEFGCSVIVVHHRSDKAGASDVRGSSGFRANFDSVLSVEADRATRTCQVRVLKHKGAPEPNEPFCFQGRLAGPSLAFDPITPGEHREKLKKENPYNRTAVGETLKKLGAYGPKKGVPTTVLARNLMPKQDGQTDKQWLQATENATKRLGERAGPDGDLEPYTHKGEGPRGTTLWFLPAIAD